MPHPFIVTVPNGSQPIPAFLARGRFSLEEIRKDPFKLTRHRSRLKPGKKEERINSSKTVSVDISKCQGGQHIIKQLCAELGWKLWTVPRQLGPSDVYWHSLQTEDFKPFHNGGAINRLPCMAATLKKINLTRALKCMAAIFPEEYDFHPRTWFLPRQFHEFCGDVAYEKRLKKRKNSNVYIVKPDAGTQGEGIYLIQDPNDYVLPRNGTCHVVQEYLATPLLLDKMKFDLRIYVVVVSLNPVKIYLSKEGLARLCTIPYKQPSSKNINNSYMHLTNYTLNKASDSYIHTDRLMDGSKRTLTSALAQLAKQGYDTCKLWADIEQVVVKTMLAIIPELHIAYTQHVKPGNKVKCFQILGFDILLTNELKPVLLEVNANPSLSTTFDKEVTPGVYHEVASAVDKYVKCQLIKETMQLVVPPQKLSAGKTAEPSDDADEYSEQLTTSTESLHVEECSDTDRFLYELFPGGYSGKYSRLRILERLATIFKISLSIHETLLSANSFRLFARKSCLVNQTSDLTVASIDILFLETQRRWTDAQAEKPPGMNFQAFFEVFLAMARRSKLRSPIPYEMVDNLLHFCEANLELSGRSKLRRAKLPRIRVRYTSQTNLQWMTSSSARHRSTVHGE